MSHKKQIYITQEFEETREVGREIARTLIGGEVLALHGELGAGKTTFMQGLAEELGIKRTIISPTFILMRTYTIDAMMIENLYHIDLYRIEQEKDVESIGFLQEMGNPTSIVAVEWPEKMESLLPSKRTDIFFDYLEKDLRRITVYEN